MTKLFVLGWLSLKKLLYAHIKIYYKNQKELRESVCLYYYIRNGYNIMKLIDKIKNRINCMEGQLKVHLVKKEFHSRSYLL